MSKFLIEVVDDNSFQEGWLSYVLGRPRLDEGQMDPGIPAYIDGWDMASETSGLEVVRYVFEAQHRLAVPQFKVTRPDVPVLSPTQETDSE